MKASERLMLNALLMAMVTGAQAQTVDTIDATLRSRVDRIGAQVLEQTGVPSASVAVVKGGKLVYTHAYGKARLEPVVAATPEISSTDTTMNPIRPVTAPIRQNLRSLRA